jgi:hypothetical protein
MVMRFDVAGACGVSEEIARRAEEISAKMCGAKTAIEAEFSFIMKDDNWLAQRHCADWESMPDDLRQKEAEDKFLMRHYLAGRLVVDIINHGSIRMNLEYSPGLIGLIARIEAELDIRTNLLRFLTCYGERKEMERRMSVMALIPFGC